MLFRVGVPVLPERGADPFMLVVGERAGAEQQRVDVRVPAVVPVGDLDALDGVRDAEVDAELAVLAVPGDVAPAVQDVPEGVCERVAADVREGQRREGQAAAVAQVVQDDAGQLQGPGVPDLGRVHRAGPDRSAGLQAGVGAEPVALHDADELGHAVGVSAAVGQPVQARQALHLVEQREALRPQVTGVERPRSGCIVRKVPRASRRGRPVEGGATARGRRVAVCTGCGL